MLEKKTGAEGASEPLLDHLEVLAAIAERRALIEAARRERERSQRLRAELAQLRRGGYRAGA